MSLANILFPISDVDIENVREHFGIDAEKIHRDCEVIKAWMEQQKHFPNDYDPIRVERILLRNKFRVERTKEKLENYYTSKAANKELFEKMNPRKDIMKKCLSTSLLVPMPKLFNKTERLYIMRFIGNDNEFSCELLFTLLSIALLELECLHDYATGVRVLVDFEGYTMTHFKSLNISTLSKMSALYQESLLGTVISIEYFNGPSFLGMVMDLIKLVLPEKIFKKITVHPNLNSLKIAIPEEYIPSDYGGKVRSTDEIFVDVKQFLLENSDYIMSRVETVADESKRIGTVRKNELFGVDGTFKKINLD